ncbi:hypothetical protein ACHAW6_000429 [Cyclotella cf. meneghiniana]
MYELVLPDMHRWNRAENGVDASFPMTLWDRLVPQAEMMVNLLRQANVVPKLSAYAYMNGPHDYKKCD